MEKSSECSIAPAIGAAGEQATRCRIVFFDMAVAFGGSVVILSNIVKAMDTGRFDIWVASSLPEDAARNFFPDAVCKRVKYIPPLNYVHRSSVLAKVAGRGRWLRRFCGYGFFGAASLANFVSYCKLFLSIAKIRPDVIHVNNGTEGFAIAWLLKVPCVVHMHGAPSGRSLVGRRMSSQVRRYIAISQFVADAAIACGYPSEQMTLLPNATPVPRTTPEQVAFYRNKYGADGRLLVAHIGRLVGWKGQAEFIEAFALAAQSDHSLRALIVGDDLEQFEGGYVSSLKRRVEALGLSDRVLFTGHISDIDNLIAAADVVVHTSTEPEPFGLVITEAMALGRVVIGSSLGAPKEIISHGVDGFVVDPNAKEALAATIARVASDPALREQLGAAAKKKVETSYSLPQYIEKLSVIYDEVAA